MKSSSNKKKKCCEQCEWRETNNTCIKDDCKCHTPPHVEERKDCTAFTEHDQMCDCGKETCWEEQLRLRVNFDKNPDREVCILFIHRLLSDTILSKNRVREEVESLRRTDETQMTADHVYDEALDDLLHSLGIE